MQTPCPQPAWATPAFSGDIGKGAVAIVLEQVRYRFLSGGKAFQPRAVDQKNVQPAVVVVVIKRHAAAGGFQQIFIFVLAAEDGFRIEARGPAHVDKRNAEIGRLLLSCAHASDKTSAKGRTSADRESERRNFRREKDHCNTSHSIAPVETKLAMD